MAYGVADFGSMTMDRVRIDAYLASMNAVITPESTVLDLGCGTGFLTLAALRMGAAHVTAVEVLDAVRALPKVIADNGYDDRCTVVQGDVREIELDRFDLIVSDLRGSVPLYGEHLQVLAYARRNLLADGGTLLPQSDILRAALVSVPDWYEKAVAPWRLDGHRWDHFEQQVLATPVRPGSLPWSAVVSEPVTWGSVDYGDVEALEARRFGGTFSTNVTEGAEAHGLALWFDATISPGCSYSTEPSEYQPTYGRVLHPFSSPVTLTKGDTVEITIKAFRSGSDWSWDWGVSTAYAERRTNTLDALPISGLLSAASSGSAPTNSETM